MGIHDDLGMRMKSFYEAIPQTKLVRRMPVIIRIDGKAFHTFTRGMEKPFDDVVEQAMTATTEMLCSDIQGCVLGYTQSDEISLLLIDYKKLNSGAWFDYKAQKLCSVAASMATYYFNRFFKYYYDVKHNLRDISKELESAYFNAWSVKGALFDARCFNIPKEEATNYFYWRQIDAIRNSIQSVGQAHFSHSQLRNVSCKDIQKKLADKGIIWSDLPVSRQRGVAVIQRETDDGKKWITDMEIPIFRDEGRAYIDDLLLTEDESENNAKAT